MNRLLSVLALLVFTSFSFGDMPRPTEAVHEPVVGHGDGGDGEAGSGAGLQTVAQFVLVVLEAEFSNRWLAGAAVFDNSFGQDSQFLYVGKSWPIAGSEHFYFKLMGGLLHGYKEPYEDKIPLNGLGIAPAIVPAVGARYRWLFGEINLGGLAVVTVTGGFRF